MRTQGVRRLPIVDAEGRLRGIVTADDLYGLFGHRLGQLAEELDRQSESNEMR